MIYPRLAAELVFRGTVRARTQGSWLPVQNAFYNSFLPELVEKQMSLVFFFFPFPKSVNITGLGIAHPHVKGSCYFFTSALFIFLSLSTEIKKHSL